jgi:hypothetical protein
MARKRAGRKGGMNRSEFIRGVFAKNPGAKLSDAKKAWADAGNKDTLNNGLFYLVKSKLGLAGSRASNRGKRRGRPVGSVNGSVASSRNGASSRASAGGYEAVENRLDEVIHLLWELGDHDLVAEFKGARRKIAAKLV